MTVTVEAQIIDYLRTQAIQKGIQEDGIKLTTRYLDEGIIDSLGLIMMIDDLEQRFAIRFSAEDMQSYEFQTVSGLASIIERLKVG
jgi:acyl carrier protein